MSSGGVISKRAFTDPVTVDESLSKLRLGTTAKIPALESKARGEARAKVEKGAGLIWGGSCN